MPRALGEFLWQRIPTLKIRSVSRLLLDRELMRQFRRLRPGIVLDVGAKAGPYREQVPARRYLRLDINPSKQPDICVDVHELEWEADFFDTVLAIEILEHLYDPQRAIDRVHDVLKPGGVCILSTRFFFRYHPDPQDHYRFTWDSLRYLFRHFRHVEVHHHGNRAQALWEIINAGGKGRVLLNVLNPLIARLRADRSRFPLGFVVYAQNRRVVEPGSATPMRARGTCRRADMADASLPGATWPRAVVDCSGGRRPIRGRPCRP